MFCTKKSVELDTNEKEEENMKKPHTWPILAFVLFTVMPSQASSKVQSQSELACLTDALFFEARAEPKAGQIAVGMVVKNRIKSEKYPKSICGVVKQRTSKSCQFSWMCNKKIMNKVINRSHTKDEKYQQLQELAEDILLGVVKDNTGGATHFHAKYVKPRWRLEKTAKIGNHLFYK